MNEPTPESSDPTAASPSSVPDTPTQRPGRFRRAARLVGFGGGFTALFAAIGLLTDGISLHDRLLAREPLDLGIAYLNRGGEPYVELARDAGPVELGRTAIGWGASLQLRPGSHREEVHLLTFVPAGDGAGFAPVLYTQEMMESVHWKLGIDQVPSVTVVLLEGDEELARQVRDRVAERIDYEPSDVRGQVHLTEDGCFMHEPRSRGAAAPPADAPFACAVWEHHLVELLKEQSGLRFVGRTIPTAIPDGAENG
jgi:hypothetical protein